MYFDRPMKITVNHSVTDILLAIAQTVAFYNTKYEYQLLKCQLPFYTHKVL